MLVLRNGGGHQVAAPLSADVLHCLELVQERLHKYAVIAGGSSVAQVQHIEGRPVHGSHGDVDIWIPRYPGGPAVSTEKVVTALTAMSRVLRGTVFDVVVDDGAVGKHRGSTKLQAYDEALRGIVDFKLSCDPAEPGGEKGYRQFQLVLWETSSAPRSVVDAVEGLVSCFDISIVKCAVVNRGGDVVLTEQCRNDLATGQFRYTVESCVGQFSGKDMAMRIAKYIDRGFELCEINFAAAAGHIIVKSAELSTPRTEGAPGGATG